MATQLQSGYVARQNLTESDKGLWFNQLSDSEPASASSLDISAVSRKKIMGAKKAEESNDLRERLSETSPDYSLSFFIVLNKYLLET